LDMDIFENYEKIESYDKFINFLVLNWYDKNSKNCFYVFLDEFQKYDNFTKILKNIYDNHSNIKIIASGSSSLSIKNNIQESLAWRKRIINIFPLNFEEFLVFKNEEKLAQNLKNIKKLKWKWLYDTLNNYYKLLEEFMVFWWYPEVVLEKDIKEKQKILASIFDLFIKKDLWEYLKLEKIKIANDILKYIAVNNWNKIKYEEIAKIANISVHIIKNYIEILKELFIFIELKPYFTNKNLELVKIPKIYFIDNWVRNYFIKNFIELEFRQDKWALFEWFFIQELLKKWLEIETIKYWNDKNKREVDVVIDNVTDLEAYELKFQKNVKSDDLTWLKAFKNIYSINWYIVNLDIQESKSWINFILPFF
jgi:predicted AAA+ superfamily ATPase